MTEEEEVVTHHIITIINVNSDTEVVLPGLSL